MLHFQKLDVYQRSIELLALANRVRGQLPKGHADLADQLRRSAQSIPQNIAEGCGRTSRADKAKHYTIARGSAMESASHFDIMQVDGILDRQRCRSRPTVSFRFTSAATITVSLTLTFTSTIAEARRNQ